MKIKLPNIYYYFKKLPKLAQKLIALTLTLTTLLVGTGLIYLFGPWAKKASAVWFDDNYSYRQRIPIDTHTDTLTTEKLP